MNEKELLDTLGLTNKNKDENFEEKYANSRLNFGDIDSELMNRTPYDNDRPELERYFNSLTVDEEGLTEPVVFYGYVSNQKNNNKNSKNTVMINVVNEFGEIMAAHVWSKSDVIRESVGEVIKFEGRIYKYQFIEKYGIAVIENTVEIINVKPCGVSNSPWNKMLISNGSLKVIDLINEFIKADDYEQHVLLIQSERILDRISELMFGVSGLIYPLLLNMYLMRDDTSDIKVIDKHIKHLTILSTVVIDYIITIQPSSYEELLYVITYVVLNYLGLNVDNPKDKKCRKYLKQTLNEMKINYNHAAYHVGNLIKCVGGNLTGMTEYIPEYLKTDPEKLPEIAREQFALRILTRLIPKNKQKFYIKNK